MKRSWIIAGIVILVVVWVASSRITVPQPSSSTQPLPTFALEDYDGTLVRSEDYVGQPLIINSWAVWCPFCKEELVEFAAAQKELGDTVTIIAIDRAEPLRAVKGFTDERGVTDTLVFLLDPADSFYQSIGGFTMPETVFVDANGMIVDHKRGPMQKQEILERAQKLL